MHIFIDFETRSTVDIKTRGAWVYSEDETTDALCLAIKVDGMTPLIWMNEGITGVRGNLRTDEVWELVNRADEIHAWNAGFERAIWQNVCHRRYGWPALPIHKLRCTMAKAAYHSLPMSLDAAASALGLPGKDIDGYKLMLKLSKPRKRDPPVWWGDPDMFRRLGEYCKEDVNAEARIDAELYPLPDQELKIWQLDQEINARGILADVVACRNAVAMIERDADSSLARFKELTHSSVSSPKQVTAFLKWLHSHGCVLPGLTKADVINGLQMPGLRPEVREALQIRQKLGLSSVSKFQAIIDRVSSDGRLRGMFMYHGAGTGRWAGRGVQLQNLPRKSYRADDLAALESGDYDWFDTFETSLPASMSTMVRGMFTAGPGNELAVADYSSIEARVTAWIAGEETVLNAFRNKLDLYKVAATRIYGVLYEAVTKDQRQIGKTATLALGFGGGVGAFQSMARIYGVHVEDDLAQDIVTKWRAGHPAITKFWYECDKALTAAVTTGRTQTVGPVKYGITGRFLACKLPSGRCIRYPFPKIENRSTKWGTEKESVTYMSSSMGKWFRNHIWFGLAVENIVQGIARDLLADALLRVEAAGLPVVLHVHDEVGAEVPKGSVTVEEFERLTATPPAWADGCPIGAEGWIGKRYRK